MRSVPRILASLGLALLSTTGSAAPQGPTFKGGTERVRVDVLVTDEGEPVMGLGARDFRVLDNGVVQKPDLLEAGGPIKVLLVLDTSSSVKGVRFEQLVAASGKLLDALKPADQVGLLTFSERLDELVPLTIEHDRVRDMLGRVRPGRRTALFDAVFAGLSLGAGDSGRWLVLVFSDGRDTASWLPARRVLDAARRSSLVVCGVTVGEGSNASRVFIDSVADVTGGRVAAATSDHELSRLFVGVLNEFRSRYVLTYVPEGVKRGDGWHALDVKLSRARGRVTARRGYVSTTE
jgi:Ca-activated chloride channel homolog